MKRWLGMDVFTAARSRLAEVFDAFERVFVSFSGGKDSGVVVQLALDIAREKGRLPLDVLHIDLEAWYAHTDAFVTRIMTRPDVRPHWICLPIHLRNSVSQIQPHWLCWDPDARDLWVRKLPTHPETYFSWFRRGMEFEEFVPLFAEHFAEGRSCASVVAIRCDESLNRFRTIASTTKRRWNGRSWSTVTPSGVVNVYPIYDWKTEDVWTATGRQRWDYNKIYDLMHLVGVGIHQMRLCQPYGDDQRKGLWLFKMLEPETWSRVVGRVQGANFGNRYVDDKPVLGEIQKALPATLVLAGAALCLTLVCSLSSGIVCALYEGTFLDRLIRGGVFLGTAMPSFWAGLLLMWLFAVKLDLVPTSGMDGPSSVLLPAVTLSLAYIATYTRLIRANMIQNKQENYILYARVRGLPERSIIRHMFKNSLQASLTALGMSLPKLIAGTFVVESIFAWPGIGRLCVAAIFNRDFPVIQAYVLIMAVLFVVGNVLVDILSAAVDPRLRKEF